MHVAVVEREHDRVCGVQRRRHVGQRERRDDGRPVWFPVHGREPAGGFDECAEPWAFRARTGLPPARNPQQDEAGVPRVEHVPPEVHPFERAGHERFHDDVEVGNQASKEGPSVGRLQIKRDEAFVPGVDCHHRAWPSDVHWQSGSPTRGCSTLTTSAPKSARSMPATPPATMRERSSTRTPAKGQTIGHDAVQPMTKLPNRSRGRGPRRRRLEYGYASASRGDAPRQPPQ